MKFHPETACHRFCLLFRLEKLDKQKFIGCMIGFAGLAMGGRLNAVTFQGLLLLLYMAFISAGAYTLWSLLLKYNSVSKVAVFGFCTPIFGVILSAVILGENTGFQMKTLLALLFVCIGIIIVNYKKKQENFSH